MLAQGFVQVFTFCPPLYVFEFDAPSMSFMLCLLCVCAEQKNVVVAANKVSSKVTAVSFSDDSSYFVTAGNRHVKFWYLDHDKTSKVPANLPPTGTLGSPPPTT